MSDKQKPWKPEPPFVIHRAAMRASEAWSALDHNAKRFLERLELEHMKHGGKDNGRLPCPYNDLVEYGMRRETIARSIRRTVMCGFVEITRRGRRSAAGANPALYRLTYLPHFTGAWPTDEWENYRPNGPLRQTRSPQKAKQKAAAKPPQIQNVGTETGTVSVPETVPMSVPETVLPNAEISVPKPVLLSKVLPCISAAPLGCEHEQRKARLMSSTAEMISLAAHKR
jgi:hypothetical protein